MKKRIKFTARLFVLLFALLVALTLFGFNNSSYLAFYTFYRHILQAILLGIAIVLFVTFRKHKQANDAEVACDSQGSGKIVCQRILLGLLGFVAILTFFDFGTFCGKGEFIHYYEFTHYYLGAKYFPEVGYHNFYLACVAAEREISTKTDIRVIRDLSTNNFIAVNLIQSEIQHARRNFSPQRWRSFFRDYAFFRSRLYQVEDFLQDRGYKIRSDPMEDLLQDCGYNASPIWTMSGYLLTNALSSLGLNNETSVNFLAVLDILLLLMLFACIYWAFGYEVMILAIVFWAVNPFEAYGYTSGSFLRQDWFFATISSICLFKKQKFALSGAMLAYAIGTRLFPIVFVLFPLFSFIRIFIKTKNLSLPLVKYGVALTLVLSMLFFISLNMAGGMSTWKDFYKKITVHNNGFYQNHISFRNLFVFETGKTYKDFRDDTEWRREKERLYLKQRSLMNILIVIIFVAFLYVLREESVWKGMSVSSFLPFLFFYPANYYFVVFLPLVFYFYEAKLKYLVVFFTLLAVGNICRIYIKENDVFNAILSVYIFIMLVWFLFGKWRDESRDLIRPSSQTSTTT